MNICERPNFIIKKTPTSKWEFLTHKKYTSGHIDNYYALLDIPCGTCKECLKNKSLQYKNRCLLEMEEAITSYFITLTYNDKNLKDHSTHIKDLEQFIKDLRNFFKNNYGLTNIKYLGTTEYGDNSMRPHAHIIIFNIPLTLNDLILLKPTKTPKKAKQFINKKINEDYFTNNIIKQIWGKGNITISNLNETRINYIVSYLFKSFNGITKFKRKELAKKGYELPQKIQSRLLGAKTIEKRAPDFFKYQMIYINGHAVYANKYIDTISGQLDETRTYNRLINRLDKIGRVNRAHKTAINNKKGTL